VGEHRATRLTSMPQRVSRQASCFRSLTQFSPLEATMKSLLVVLGAVLAIFVCVPQHSLAANASIYAAGANHLLRTNTGGGSCDSYIDTDESIITTCSDGNVQTTISSTVGCLSASGGGAQCVVDPPPSNAYATIDVPCPNGQVWTITNGNGEGNSHCSNTQDGGNNITGGHCANGEGSSETNTATLDCRCGTNHDQVCCTTTGGGICSKKS
jgi:hypothetical protein